jgi:hypothetical protein
MQPTAKAAADSQKEISASFLSCDARGSTGGRYVHWNCILKETEYGI